MSNPYNVGKGFEELFYIASAPSPYETKVLWLGELRRGYTPDLSLAAKLTRAEAEEVVNTKRGYKMFPVTAIDRMAIREVRMESLRWYEDQLRPAESKGDL